MILRTLELVGFLNTTIPPRRNPVFNPVCSLSRSVALCAHCLKKHRETQHGARGPYLLLMLEAVWGSLLLEDMSHQGLPTF